MADNRCIMTNTDMQATRLDLLITRILRSLDDFEARNLPALKRKVAEVWKAALSEDDYSMLEIHVEAWWNNEL